MWLHGVLSVISGEPIRRRGEASEDKGRVGALGTRDRVLLWLSCELEFMLMCGRNKGCNYIYLYIYIYISLCICIYILIAIYIYINIY